MRENASKLVSKHVKEFRYMLGLSQAQFAMRVGIELERIKELETGKNVLNNGLELLQITNSCNVQYVDLFTRDDDSIVERNAKFGKNVYNGIAQEMKKRGLNPQKVADKLGIHRTAVDSWLNHVTYPSPFNFQNLINLLNLDIYKLKSFSKEEAPEDEPEPQTIVPVEPEKAEATEDSFEQRAIKVMRLQRELDTYVTKLDNIIASVTKLRDELASLK